MRRGVIGDVPSVHQNDRSGRRQRPSIEELIDELRNNPIIVSVAPTMRQAARVSRDTAIRHVGDMVQIGPIKHIFINPDDTRTQDHISGRFG